VVETILSPLRNLDITGSSLKWNCADGFQRQCYPLLAAWVGDYSEQVMIAQVSYSSCLMCEIPKGALMGHSTIGPLDNPRDQDVYSELLDKTNIDILNTLGVHPIHNLFWQYPLCIVYRLWQPNELHQLLLGLVKDFLLWLLKYLKARNLKDRFDNQFTSVPRYPGLQHPSKPFDSMKSSSWQGKEMWGMIRTVGVNCAPILDCSKDDGKTLAETASGEMVMGAVRAGCEFPRLVRQQNHSDLSVAALDDAQEQFYKKDAAFRDQKMLKSARPKSMNCWQQNPISYAYKRFIKSVLQWRFRCMGLKRDIHQVTPAKHKLFDKLFQHHKRQLLQDVRSKPVTGHRSTFAKKPAQLKTAAEEDVYDAANMTADKGVKFQVRPSDAETDTTALSIANMDCIANQLEREIDGITSNEQMCLKKKLFIRLIQFEAWGKAIGVQELQRNHQTACNPFPIPKDASCEPYSRVNFVNGFWRQFQDLYF